MTRARSSRVLRRQVTRILEKCEVTGPAVPVEKIARSLGAELRFLPYDGELAGMLARNVGAKPVIGINSRHSKARQRFTIAHELGHLTLHDINVHIDRDFRVMNRDSMSSTATNPLEIEANRFAAELLMPYDMVLAEFDEQGVDMEHLDEVSRLAKRYGVSVQAMMHRIANILYI